MPITFGSIGDIISVCLIVKDLVDALDKSRGSSAEYQAIIRELWSLERALLQVAMLSKTCEDCVELNALRVTAMQAVDNCRLSLNEFLDKVGKYERSLRGEGSGSFLKDSARRIQWQVSKKDELAKFRVEVIAHCSSINMLIATAQVNLLRINERKLNERLDEEESRSKGVADKQETSLADIKDLAKENNRLIAKGNQISDRIYGALRLEWLTGLGSDLKSLMRKTYLMNVAIYGAVVSIQALLPSHLERTLMEEPFILEDAVGRLSPVHLQFICSWEAFEDVLEHRFRDFQGYQKVKERAYAFQELATNKDISRAMPWRTAFLPGQRVGMDLIFRKQDGGEAESTSCPKCKMPTDGPLDRSIECIKCGMHYHRIREVMDEHDDSSDDDFLFGGSDSREDSPDFGVRILRSIIDSKRKKRAIGVTDLGEDDIASFKRVRVITAKKRKSRLVEVNSFQCENPYCTALPFRTQIYIPNYIQPAKSAHSKVVLELKK